MATRGLVLVPDFSADIGRNYLKIRNVGAGPMEERVRQHLPYWDKFDLPDNPIVAFGLSPDLEFLRSEGVVRKTNARPNFSGGAAELWVRCQLEAWRLNESTEPGQWSLAQQGDTFWLPEDERIRTRTIETTWYASLPGPGADVPLQEILEFKGRRASELQALRAGMDELFLSVIKAGDIPRASNVALERVQAALANLNAATSESWTSRVMSTMKVEIAIPNIVVGALAGVGAATQFSLPIALGAGLGAVASAVKFELKQGGASEKGASGLSGLAYAYKVECELK